MQLNIAIKRVFDAIDFIDLKIEYLFPKILNKIYNIMLIIIAEKIIFKKLFVYKLPITYRSPLFDLLGIYDVHIAFHVDVYMHL